jgi:endonuclease/exonuclease/phosphatase family metal-dependent hydrolase
MPGITFLFWNVNRRPLDERVGRIVATESADVVLIAEPGTPPADLNRRLEGSTGSRWRVEDGSAGRFTVCSRLPRRSLRIQLTDERWRLYRVVPDPIPEFLLAVAHLPSKREREAETQAHSARGLVADLDRVERRRKHRRTVVVGDLNMNPFEPGVAGAGGLHGMMSRAVAGRETREVVGQEHRMFYNPMWGLLGDRTPGPPGTYYRAAGEAVNYFWNTYDQVLLRPGLCDRLRDLKVLTSDGVEGLLTPNGLPDAAAGSDHLPLVFRLDW